MGKENVEDSYLSIGTWLISEEVNGPGRRLVLWLQGCHFACPECFNPEFHDASKGIRLSCADIVELITAAPDIEGVTLSGGEPLLQVQSLLPLLRWIKAEGFTLVCYSGYRLEELNSGVVSLAEEFLTLCDVLIDGRFDVQEKTPLLWRGSKNQNVHFLTDRYSDFKEAADKTGTKQVELIQGNGTLTTTGFMDSRVWEKLQKRLSEVIPDAKPF